MAITLAEAARRLGRYGGYVLAVVVGAILLCNLLVTNQYLCKMVHNGPGPIWTDAIYSLADVVKASHFERVYATDWGIKRGLRLLHGGGPYEELPGIDQTTMHDLISTPGYVFVGRREGEEIIPGANRQLQLAAAALNLRKNMLAIISDHHGRPTFEVFCFAAAPANVCPD
jgi:hypothetical protein